MISYEKAKEAYNLDLHVLDQIKGLSQEEFEELETLNSATELDEESIIRLNELTDLNKFSNLSIEDKETQIKNRCNSLRNNIRDLNFYQENLALEDIEFKNNLVLNSVLCGYEE